MKCGSLSLFSLKPWSVENFFSLGTHNGPANSFFNPSYAEANCILYLPCWAFKKSILKTIFDIVSGCTEISANMMSQIRTTRSWLDKFSLAEASRKSSVSRSLKIRSWRFEPCSVRNLNKNEDPRIIDSLTGQFYPKFLRLMWPFLLTYSRNRLRLN